ncbi:hypothetical protein DH2020_021235 [Rehmannia glutinosa]|uniref:RNase H type-1 domain-containing protein n=1 Tax=Rehmannia glutinosa TaxID=99300 RepID=A0ABR0WE26_REHGL
MGHGERFYDKRITGPEGETQKEWGVWLRAPNRRFANQEGERWLHEDDVNGGMNDRSSPENFQADEVGERFSEIQNSIIARNQGLRDFRGSVTHGTPSISRNGRDLDKGKEVTNMQVLNDGNEELLGFALGKDRKRRRGPNGVSVWRVAGMGDLVEEWAEGNESVMDFVANCLLCMDEWKKVKCLMVLWSLWRERNNEFWNNVHASAKETLHAAVNYLTEWCATNFGSGTEKTFRAADPCAQTAKWSKPNRLQFKCNVDATLSLERNATYIGMVVRDDKGEFVVARTITFPGIFAPKEAEAIGVREALSWIK